MVAGQLMGLQVYNSCESLPQGNVQKGIAFRETFVPRGVYGQEC